MLKQVHGCEIIDVRSYPAGSAPYFAEADGIITALRGICLVIRTADCVPVFALDSERKVLGAVHSGWRGCQLGIAGKLIEEMERIYGSSPKNIHTFILPSIGPESYTVNMDVAKYFPEEMSISGGLIFLNLWKSVSSCMLKAGILPENIFSSEICNMKNNDEYFSHRKGDSGRNLNFGYIK
jgi:YfiH family protein